MTKYLLPLIFILLLTFTLIGSSADLYSTYDQRIKFTIDNTKVDSALSWFPVTVFLDSTQGEEVFAELPTGANFDRCAFTKSDGTTQLKGDCEKFTASFSKLGIAQPFHAFTAAPAAQYYNGKTYIVFHGDDLDPYITYYNHSTNLFATPVKVGDNPLSENPHGAPLVHLDNNHYIHVFWGDWRSYVKHSKSTNVEDISAWGAADNATGNDATYKHIIQVGTDFFFIYRKTVAADEMPLVLKKSVDNMASWGAEQTIVDFGVNYAIYPMLDGLDTEVEGDHIHITWKARDMTGGVYGDYLDAYHAYYDISESKMYAQDGTDEGTTISKVEADAKCLIYECVGVEQTGSTRCRIYNSVPYVLIHLTDGTLKFRKWTGSAWSTAVTVLSTVLDCMFEVTDASNMIIWLTNTATDDVEKWTTSNGGTDWAKESTILTDADLSAAGYKFLYFRPVTDGLAKLNIVFTEQPASMDYVTPLQLFAYGSDGFLGRTGLYHISADGWSISNSADTDFYMYYDKDATHNTSNVCKTGGVVAQGVYDGNFILVQHGQDATTSTTLDATSNNNDGTKKAANQPTEITGKAGQAQDFESTNSEYIDLGDLGDLGTTYTVECIANVDSIAAATSKILVSYRTSDQPDSTNMAIQLDVYEDDARFLVRDDAGVIGVATKAASIAASTWYYLAGYRDGGTTSIQVNAGTAATDSDTFGTLHMSKAGLGASYLDETDAWGGFADAKVDEVRISNSVRTAAWIKATYNTLYDTLLTYGNQETEGVTTNVMFMFSDF